MVCYYPSTSSLLTQVPCFIVYVPAHTCPDSWHPHTQYPVAHSLNRSSSVIEPPARHSHYMGRLIQLEPRKEKVCTECFEGNNLGAVTIRITPSSTDFQFEIFQQASQPNGPVRMGQVCYMRYDLPSHHNLPILLPQDPLR